MVRNTFNPKSKFEHLLQSVTKLTKTFLNQTRTKPHDFRFSDFESLSTLLNFTIFFKKNCKVDFMIETVILNFQILNIKQS